MAPTRQEPHASSPDERDQTWIVRDCAACRDGASVRHKAVGCAIHHAASMFREVFNERWYGGRAGISASLACVVDCTIGHHRLQPGCAMRPLRRSLVGVYAAVAVGLFAESLLGSKR